MRHKVDMPLMFGGGGGDRANYCLGLLSSEVRGICEFVRESEELDRLGQNTCANEAKRNDTERSS